MTDVALMGLATNSLPFSSIRVKPLALTASKFAPRNIKVTSFPVNASFTPNMPPMAPAPTIQIFMLFGFQKCCEVCQCR